jgi:chromosome segregation protein
MVHFSKFRLSGFKSFVDLTEVEIGPGLNGVVGPNGCGKSNLLEALRWVMGETSAKKMRGGGMEDVIFAGTAQRPPRSAAEVSLFLDNKDLDAPHPFEKVQDIQITRRIERDKGSLYKVNGKTVRARDVQMFFADTVSGANSPAMVSQGKITQIINAKPHERRHVLEESAGVAGLYTRRHEAELRLRAAESNLTRLDDSMQTSRTQLNSLRRQAGAARKYTELSDKIRKLEMLIAAAEWSANVNKFKDKNAAYEALETQIAKAMAEVSKHHNAHEKILAALPALRQEDMKLQASLQALKIEQDRLAQDQKELQESLERARRDKDQLEKDIEENKSQSEETKSALSELASEEQEAQDRLKDAPQRLEEKQTALSTMQQVLDKLERKYQDNLNKQAQLQAEAKEAATQYDVLKDKKQRSEARIADMQESLERIKKEKEELGCLEELKAALKEAHKQLDIYREALDTAENNKEIARKATEECQKSLQDFKTDERILAGEIATLEKLIASMAENQKGDVLENLKVKQGYEKALSRALGDLGLNASLDDSAEIYWELPSQNLDIAPNNNIDLPLLNEYVSAPENLKMALAGIYVCEDEGAAKSLSAHLKAGESLVTKSGYYYRWDGLRIKPDANTGNAGLSLEHKNRLELLIEQKQILDGKISKAETSLESAEKHYMVVYEQLRQDTQNLQQAENRSKDLFKQSQKLENEITQIDMRCEHAVERFTAAKNEYDEINAQYALAETKISSLNTEETEKAANILEDLKEQIAAQREMLNNQRSDYDVLSFQVKQDEQRLKRILEDRHTLTNRAEKASKRLEELNSRLKETLQRIEKLENNPKSKTVNADELFEKITHLEAQCTQSSDSLAAQESARADSSAELRKAEQELSSYKEKRAALQTEIAAIKTDLERIRAQITASYEMQPAALKQKLDELYENGRPDEKTAQADLIRFRHERENMGPVNLRADVEAEELQSSLSELERECEDLTAAIDHLRKGIAKLNKEARERMRTAFVHVNAHFQKLFTRLFNGGQAHLELIESDDPLEAGLEIFAQPPGKALQSLSLLSGGEQTMASIALIFAMFMTNPSPICVLDEIDAPLDDSNVDRMCDLLEDIASEGKTRFMVITHHRMTMARMDRLYGVTMSEKGVSKLVSVDLATQASFIEQLTA